MPPLSKSRLIGEADANEKVQVTVSIRRKEGAPPMPDHEYWMSTPPGRRKFLSPEEFTGQYGAAQNDIDMVAEFGRAHGLAVVEAHAGRRSVILTGSVAQMDAAFGVKLNYYEAPSPRPSKHARRAGAAPKQTYRGYAGAISLPQEVAEAVEVVVGLDNRRTGGRTWTSNDPPNISPWTVPQVVTQYDFPTNSAAGQTIGVVSMEGGYDPADITTYFSGFNGTLTAPTIVTRKVNGGVNEGNDFETLQDICISSSVAQGATIAVYFVKSDGLGDSQSWLNLLSRLIVPDPGETAPPVVTSSYFVAQSDDGSQVSEANLDAISTKFQELAARGITFFQGSGDWGSDAGVGDGKVHVIYPGSDPWVTSCGGTSLGTSSGTIDETVWNDAIPFVDVAGGGQSSNTGWRTTWSHIVAGGFTGKDGQQALLYDEADGYADVVGFDGSGNVSFDQPGSNWSKTWDSIVPGVYIDGGEQVLLYDRNAGQAAIVAFNDHGKVKLDTINNGWRKTWDLLIPGNFIRTDRQQVLLYDRNASHADIVAFDTHGHVALDTPNGDWGASWNIIVAGNFTKKGGYQQALLYDRNAGQAAIVAFDSHGKMNFNATNGGWRKTWDVIIAGDFIGLGRDQVLLYDRKAGHADIVAFDTHGHVSLDTRNSGWRQTWTCIVAGYFQGNSRQQVLLYDRAAGHADLIGFDNSGNISFDFQMPGWRTSWNCLVVGYFLNNSQQQVLAYDRAAGEGDVFNFAEVGSLYGATGGGVSDHFALPPWQNLAGVPPSFNDGKVRRGVPDVAGNASPNSGYLMSGAGQAFNANGTSAVGPLYAGLAACLIAKLGQPIGFLNPTLYSLGESVCRDVTVGNNLWGDPSNKANHAYSAGPGWDACTGWGVIDGNKLLSAL